MKHPKFPQKRAKIISNGIFLISLGVLVFTDLWWPGILIALWLTLGSRQYLTGRIYQAAITSFVLLGLFFTALIKFNYTVLAPVLLVVGGIYLIVREYAFPKDTNGEDKADEIEDDADIE